MDYSLLVDIHFRDDNTCDKTGLSPFFCALVLINISFSVHIVDEYYVIVIELRLVILFTLSGKHDSYQSEKFMRSYRFLEAERYRTMIESKLFIFPRV